MRVLIIGGFGFIGGRLADHLLRAGHKVVLGSRNTMGSPAWLPLAQVAQIEWDNDRVLERQCDGIDVVIQAAGMNAQDCADDPVGALAFNGLATARLVAAASRVNVKRLIYLSSAHVYASPLVGAITEKTCLQNLHPYATSHIAGEYATLTANHDGKVHGFVLRLSNVFGAPMHKNVNCWKLLVNDLCKQAVQTRKLVLNTSGQQQRDFISMTEVCGVIEHFTVDHGDSEQSGIFNVGAGLSQSVLAMAQLIQQRCIHVLGYEPELQRVQDGTDKRQLTHLSYGVNKLAVLGFKSKFTNKIVEIDELLRYCESTYIKKWHFGV